MVILVTDIDCLLDANGLGKTHVPERSFRVKPWERRVCQTINGIVHNHLKAGENCKHYEHGNQSFQQLEVRHDTNPVLHKEVVF